MNREDIIRMAEECGIPEFENNESQAQNIMRFAALVRKDYSTTHANIWLDRIHKFILAEREACAKVCAELYIDGENDTGLAAEMIRARGDKHEMES